MKRRASLVLVLLLAAAAIAAYVLTRRPGPVVLTGVVTTDDAIVSSEIQGRLQKLLVGPGDAVKAGDLLAVIQPAEWNASLSFYDQGVLQAESDLRSQEAQADEQVRLAEAGLAAARAQAAQAGADLENADLAFQRESTLFKSGTDTRQAYDQARTAHDGAAAHAEALRHQAAAAEASLALARSQKDQVAARRAALAAAKAQRDKAAVQLGYTEIRAPIGGTVDVRASLQGEVVNPGQAIVTLIDPDDLWVRADVEEGAVDRIRLGDKLTVRLPSGAEREGTVFFRGVDADYATQRDVSRTKRDIKTFEIRLRCDNRDRSLAAGMTAYVLLPP
jgi:multidrug resistance efflux pump